MATLRQFVARLRALVRRRRSRSRLRAGDGRAPRDGDGGQHPHGHDAGRSKTTGCGATRRRHVSRSHSIATSAASAASTISLQDLRFAARLMIKDRWFSAAAIAAIALGIGANTVGFTIVNAAFLRGFPFEEADRLRAISWRPDNGRRVSASYLDLEDWRAQSQSFSGIAAYCFGAINISDDRVRAGTDAGRVGHGQSLRRPAPAPGARPHLRRGGRATRRRAGRHHRLRDLETPVRSAIRKCSDARCGSTARRRPSSA